MPFALLIVGLALLVTAIRGTTGAFFTLVKGDFSGNGNFIYWIVAIMVIGAVGYIKKLQPVSDLFLALILIVLFLKQGTGFFSKFTQQIANPVAVNPPTDSGSSGATGNIGMGDTFSPSFALSALWSNLTTGIHMVNSSAPQTGSSNNAAANSSASQTGSSNNAAANSGFNVGNLGSIISGLAPTADPGMTSGFNGL